MLVLGRKAGEKIVLTMGECKVTFTICGIEGNQVRVGIDAPKEVIIDREEVHQLKAGNFIDPHSLTEE